MIIKSYAKINLSLAVNYKNKSHLHEIQSFFCLVDLADVINLKKIKGKKDKINFNGPFSKLVKKKSNSIINLLKLLRDLKLLSNYYYVNVTKNIPVFAGLGGGTSNAAFILKNILKKKLNHDQKIKIEKKIGSDLSLFLHNQGFLEKLGFINAIKNRQKFFFVLIQPTVKCSTKEIYSKVKKFSRKKNYAKKIINSKAKFYSLLLNVGNDLQSVVETKYPVVKKILTDIRSKEGCCFARITGSGSVCYGLFKEKIAAKQAIIKLRNQYPKLWVAFAKTI